MDNEAITGATILYDSFAQWHQEEHGLPVPKQKAFGRVLGDYFDREKATIDGKTGRKAYRGVMLK